MRLSLLCAGALMAGLLTTSASAAITAFSDDFDGRTVPGGNFDPWVAFSDNGGFPGGYFVPSIPTDNPQIAQLANDGGTNQYLNFFANYDNGVVHSGGAPNPQEAISFFIDQSFTGADTASGATWYFDFDYARNPAAPPSGSTQVGAFIRVFDPVFNLIGGATLDTIGATDAFQAGSLSVTLDPAWTAGQIQFGFNNLVGGFENSGMFYDNVRIANTPLAIPEPGSFALLSVGALGFVGRRRRRS